MKKWAIIRGLVFPFLILFFGLANCGGLTIKTSHGFMGPDVYELTDGDISVKYYNGNLCQGALLKGFNAKDVLKEVKRQVESGELKWELMRNKVFAKEYLHEVCYQMKLEKAEMRTSEN